MVFFHSKRMQATSFALTVALALVPNSESHPLCIDFTFPKLAEGTYTTCPSYNAKEVCIQPADESAKIGTTVTNWGISSTDSANCVNVMTQMACSQIDGWTGHTYDGETGTPRVVPILCDDFAKSIYSACGSIEMTNNPFLSPINTVEEYQQVSGTIASKYDNQQSFLDKFAGSGYCVNDKPYEVPEDNDDFVSTSKLCVEKISTNNFLNFAPIPGHSGFAALGNQAGVVDVYNLGKQGEEITKVGSLIDISSKVENNGEKGLLGLAFHKDFENNGRVFLSYSCSSGPDCANSGDTIVEEFTVPAAKRAPQDMDGSVVANSVKTTFKLAQPQGNHNGGQILFSPSESDNALYVMMGDGGGAGDVSNYSQNTLSLLGKILRLDIDSTPTQDGYAIPSDNPFAGGQDPKPEIWAIGLRNPWRCSFDESNPSYFFCGDVGQNKREEIDLIAKGANYGWRVREGDILYDDSKPAAAGPFVEPIIAYPHEGKASVTGGYRYRGSAIPSLQGRYIFADLYEKFYVADETFENSGKFEFDRTSMECHADSPLECSGSDLNYVTTFGQDDKLELYFQAGSGLHRIVKCADDDGTGPAGSAASSTFHMNVFGVAFVMIATLAGM